MEANVTNRCPKCTMTWESSSGRYFHASDCPILADQLQRRQIQRLAATIASVQQLRKIIREAKPHLRRKVYDVIVPHVTLFIPPSYPVLMNPRFGFGRKKKEGQRRCYVN